MSCIARQRLAVFTNNVLDVNCSFTCFVMSQDLTFPDCFDYFDCRLSAMPSATGIHHSRVLDSASTSRFVCKVLLALDLRLVRRLHGELLQGFRAADVIIATLPRSSARVSLPASLYVSFEQRK